MRGIPGECLDYLLKPIAIDALKRAVTKAEERLKMKMTNTYLEQFIRNQQQTLPALTKVSIPVQDGYLFINPQDIVRCEASGSYSNFFMLGGKKLVVSLRLKICEEMLPENQFFRVHNSHIINLRFVNRYVRGRGGYVIMEDNSKVEVAAAKKDAFLAQLRHGL